MPSYADAISRIESGGRYDRLGPVTKSGDRAYGRYQVMGANVPSWTKQFFGQSLTPDEFLGNQAAQDAVFQGQFGNYVRKYGPEGAARAWFAGEGGMNDMARKDMLGTSVADYGQKFMAGLGGGAPPSLAAAPQATSSPMGVLSGLGQQAPGLLGGGMGSPSGILSMLGGQQAQTAPQAPPLIEEPPKQIDLSGLQALLRPATRRVFL